MSRYQPLRASRIIATCVCLRNVSIAFNDPLFDEGDITMDTDESETEHLDENTAVMQAIALNNF